MSKFLSDWLRFIVAGGFYCLAFICYEQFKVAFENINKYDYDKTDFILCFGFLFCGFVFVSAGFYYFWWGFR